MDILKTVWRPVVEILILAVAIYYIISFVRGTRGFSILTGFLVVMLTLGIVTNILELEVLRFLLTTFLAFLAVAVLVIFQPELRRMLAQLGNFPLFETPSEQRENIEVIIQAMERLSDVRIGALIAIEQSIQLQESVESGISIDCIATPEMLETIFFPNNAIHDGGVIIKGDRIAYAACIFPLSRRPDLNRSLGTRHRAALGLSEETDALVVAVSEETGSVSYAYKGQLVRGVTLEELRAFLSSILVKPTKSRSILEWLRSWSLNRVKPGPAVVTKAEAGPTKAMRDLILNNFWLKALSLVLATLIWYVITSNLTKETRAAPVFPGPRADNTLDLRCPVAVISSATDRRLLSVQPTEARVKVRGDRTILEKLSAADVQVYVKLTALSDPEGSFPLAVDLPGNVVLQQISPSHVTVKFITSTNN